MAVNKNQFNCRLLVRLLEAVIPGKLADTSGISDEPFLTVSATDGFTVVGASEKSQDRIIYNCHIFYIWAHISLQANGIAACRLRCWLSPPPKKPQIQYVILDIFFPLTLDVSTGCHGHTLHTGLHVEFLPRQQQQPCHRKQRRNRN